MRVGACHTIQLDLASGTRVLDRAFGKLLGELNCQLTYWKAYRISKEMLRAQVGGRAAGSARAAFGLVFGDGVVQHGAGQVRVEKLHGDSPYREVTAKQPDSGSASESDVARCVALTRAGPGRRLHVVSPAAHGGLCAGRTASASSSAGRAAGSESSGPSRTPGTPSRTRPRCASWGDVSGPAAPPPPPLPHHSEDAARAGPAVRGGRCEEDSSRRRRLRRAALGRRRAALGRRRAAEGGRSMAGQPWSPVPATMAVQRRDSDAAARRWRPWGGAPGSWA